MYGENILFNPLLLSTENVDLLKVEGLKIV